MQSSHGQHTAVAELSAFYSQSGAVVTFVIADDGNGETQILPIFNGFTQSLVPPVSMQQEVMRQKVPEFINPKRV